MIKAMLIGAVKLYRLLLSPWIGAGCRFEPSCSAYALQALDLHGAAIGSYLTLARLVRCHPWCDVHYDKAYVSIVANFNNGAAVDPLLPASAAPIFNN